jgi:shikimate dehydrogenase
MGLKLGLIGYPLGHSLSPKLHAAALRALGLEGEYVLYPIPAEDAAGLAALVGRLREGELAGLNVTIPHKQNVMPLVDSLSDGAGSIGAVNTLYMKDGALVGHNTDAPGFLKDLGRFLGSSPPAERKAVVLGSGGGARAVVHALLHDGWDVTVAAVLMDQARGLVESLTGRAERFRESLRAVPAGRKPLARLLKSTTLLVNASPVGMSPKADESPWPAGLGFPPRAAVYDLVYNPMVTRLVREARAAGLRARTGLGMLVEQAALSFACWTGQAAPVDVMFTAAEA